MSLIEPEKDETEEDFINRCFKDPEVMNMFTVPTNRIRFCYDTYQTSFTAIQNSLKK